MSNRAHRRQNQHRPFVAAQVLSAYKASRYSMKKFFCLVLALMLSVTLPGENSAQQRSRAVRTEPTPALRVAAFVSRVTSRTAKNDETLVRREAPRGAARRGSRPPVRRLVDRLGVKKRSSSTQTAANQFRALQSDAREQHHGPQTRTRTERHPEIQQPRNGQGLRGERRVAGRIHEGRAGVSWNKRPSIARQNRGVAPRILRPSLQATSIERAPTAAIALLIPMNFAAGQQPQHSPSDGLRGEQPTPASRPAERDPGKRSAPNQVSISGTPLIVIADTDQTQLANVGSFIGFNPLTTNEQLVAEAASRIGASQSPRDRAATEQQHTNRKKSALADFVSSKPHVLLTASVPTQAASQDSTTTATALWTYLRVQPSNAARTPGAAEDTDRPFFDLDSDQTRQESLSQRDETEEIDPGFRPIEDVEIRVAPIGNLPDDHAAKWFSKEGEVVHTMGFSRAEMESLVLWEAPALANRPLYFEETNVERHGYSVGLFQPAFSAAHFFGRIPALPYLLVSERHHQTTYALGHFRPGSFAPYKLHRPRFSVTGLAVETAAVVGMLYLIP